MNSKKITRIFLMLVFFIMIHMVSVNASVDDIVFDSDYYAHTQGDVVYYLGTDANTLRQHYKNSGIREGRQGSVYFDAKYYLAVNTDVANAVGKTNYEGAYNHFVNSGIAEGRIASKVFNVKYFLACNSDIAAAVNGNYVAAYEYYMRGLAAGELRTTIATFDLAHYLANNKDIAAAYKNNNAGALRHYLTDGIAEGRNAGHVKVAGAETKVISELTCTTDGIIEYPCSVCNGTVREVTKATGHDMVYQGQKTAPTCEKEGEAIYACSKCGETKNEPIEKLGHNYVEDTSAGAISQKPTCGNNGFTTEVCTICGNRKQTPVAATGKHTYDVNAVDADGKKTTKFTKIATCTEPGEVSYICTVCGQPQTEVIPAAHVWKNSPEELVKKTCDIDGQYKYTCQRCGETEVRTDKATGHHYVEQHEVGTNGGVAEDAAVKPATCEKAGTKVEVCTACNHRKVTEGAYPVEDHEWYVKNPKTDITANTKCGDIAEVKFSCKTCKQTKTERTKVTHEMWGYETSKTSTYPDKDTKTIKECKNPLCKETVEERTHGTKWTPLRVISHDQTTAKVYAICDNCEAGEEKTMSIKDVEKAKLNVHDYDEGIVTKEPDCTNKGKMTYTCKECGATKTEDIDVDLTKHVLLQKGKETPATCKTEGEVVYECKNCKNTTTIKTPINKAYDDTKAHNAKENSNHTNWTAGTPVAPTCATEGYTEYTCSDCDLKVKDDIKAKDLTSHQWTVGADQITEEGANKGKYLITIYCPDCNRTHVTNIMSSTVLENDGEVQNFIKSFDLENYKTSSDYKNYINSIKK